ncbi:MAG: DUF3225 domain-containing protein [Acidipila sp.]|nr:DUF3225 domain-containing protein [Acidipila sp.]
MIKHQSGMRFGWWLVIALLVSSAWSTTPVAAQVEKTGPAAEIRALLDAQGAAWNLGDIDGYMAGYWESEKTTFSGASGVSRGWQSIRDRYHLKYPDRATMGTLVFSNVEITELAADAALVLGHWQLERASGPVGGVFSVVLRKFPEGWRIIHDHTSVVQ